MSDWLDIATLWLIDAARWLRCAVQGHDWFMINPVEGRCVLCGRIARDE